MKTSQYGASEKNPGVAHAPTEPTGKYRAPALSRGLDILELLASKPNGQTQIEIATSLGLSASEIFRVLKVLSARGYITLLESSDHYVLTPKLFEMAHLYPPLRRLTSVADAPMQALANRLNQSLHLGIFQAGRVWVVWQVRCINEELVFSVRLGAQETVYESSAGLVHAAWMAESELAALLSETNDIDQSLAETFISTIFRVRGDGFAETASNTLAGVTNVSVPVFDWSRRAIASLTIP